VNAITDFKAEAAGIQIQPLTPNIGARIKGVKLRDVAVGIDGRRSVTRQSEPVPEPA
jgi:hypothetical protein